MQKKIIYIYIKRLIYSDMNKVLNPGRVKTYLKDICVFFRNCLKSFQFCQYGLLG